MGAVLDTLREAVVNAEKRGETRLQIAKRAELPPSTLYRLMSGEREAFTIDTIEKLASALGLEVNLRKKKAK